MKFVTVRTIGLKSRELQPSREWASWSLLFPHPCDSVEVRGIGPLRVEMQGDCGMQLPCHPTA